MTVRRLMGTQLKFESEAKRKLLYGFRLVSVFDISQTEGEPLPDIGQVQGDPGQHLPMLRSLIIDRGIQLDYEDLGGAEGVSRGGSIAIQRGLEPAKEFLVLAHELAHEMMHRGDRRDATSKRQRELEAEAVGYVVSQAFGVDNVRAIRPITSSFTMAMPSTSRITRYHSRNRGSDHQST